MVIAYLLISVNPGFERKVADKLLEMKEIRNLHLIYGEYDIIAEVKLSMNDLRDFVWEKVRTIDNIQQTSTLIAAEKGGD